ncbi:PTS transporter subunit IIC [Lactobacillus sp. ESL0677]|uniref:PTS galactitol transporter subunit IIC n=1 Tax=Lactobacillus sp. ESL0677 TaxID=2983208 RepID=UPI0023F8B698|nr:PTS transporter subunit IIC [Lactobacillus sp. ESL0677]WEV36269.1 PTS galactitol transporter subunit IIC [Lactobacillus sp. ESL0677]
MAGLASQINSVIQYILGMGAIVMLPIILFIVGLCFRMKPSEAFKSALTVGVGFVGIFAIFGILTNNVGPAAQAMVKHTGINLPAADLGWPALSAITWGLPIAPFVIPMTIVINIIMLIIGQTRTVDVDMWNYWHFALAGTLVYYITDNFLLGLVAAALITIIVFKLADWAAPMGEKYFGLEGISLPTVSSITFWPIGLIGNWLLDKIPGINKIKIDPKSIQKKFGVFGEPMMIGLILGILLGLLAGYDVKGLLNIGVNLAAVMLLLPRMTRVLLEGLMPISQSVQEFLTKKFPNRKDLFIGLDIAVAIGNSSIISTALLLTPIAVALAFILPGNHTLPLADLANLAVFASMIVLACKGNIFRALIISIPCIIGDLYISTAMASTITKMARNVAYKGAMHSVVTSFLDGGNPLRYWIVKIFQLDPIALVLILIVGGLVWWIYRATKKDVLSANE